MQEIKREMRNDGAEKKQYEVKVDLFTQCGGRERTHLIKYIFINTRIKYARISWEKSIQSRRDLSSEANWLYV